MRAISSTRKAVAAAHVAWRMAQRNRMIAAGLHSARLTLRSFGRVGHRLGLELAGVFFVLLALIGAAATVRSYQAWAAGTDLGGRVAAAVAFTALFGYFGVSSFWRARRGR